MGFQFMFYNTLQSLIQRGNNIDINIIRCGGCKVCNSYGSESIAISVLSPVYYLIIIVEHLDIVV